MTPKHLKEYTQRTAQNDGGAAPVANTRKSNETMDPEVSDTRFTATSTLSTDSPEYNFTFASSSALRVEDAPLRQQAIEKETLQKKLVCTSIGRNFSKT